MKDRVVDRDSDLAASLGMPLKGLTVPSLEAITIYDMAARLALPSQTELGDEVLEQLGT